MRVLRVISTVVSELKNFSKLQIITYTLKVVISRKHETLLLQPMNRSGCVLSNRAISDDLEWLQYHSLQTFSCAIFRTVVRQLTRFQLIQRVARSLCDG